MGEIRSEAAQIASEVFFVSKDGDMTIEKATERISRAIDAAVAAEREECAKVCELGIPVFEQCEPEYVTGYREALGDCAAAIRARKGE